ncbi:hypothetical protein BH11ACT8_BH11ACT8_30500 [soil metagenome]
MTQPPTQAPADSPADSSPGRFTDSTVGADASTFTEGHLQRVKRLERQLGNARKWGLRATKDLHASMIKDVKQAEQQARKAEQQARKAERRATEAEKRLATAQRRAKQAEAELARIKGSTTWKAGRVVVAVPARIKRWGRP